MYVLFGVLSFVGAVMWPFLLATLIKKTINSQYPGFECLSLSAFSVVFCLWLLSVFGS